MKAAESRQSPAMVDIWFLKVSLVCSQRSLSADKLLSRAVLRFTCEQNTEEYWAELCCGSPVNRTQRSIGTKKGHKTFRCNHRAVRRQDLQACRHWIVDTMIWYDRRGGKIQESIVTIQLFALDVQHMAENHSGDVATSSAQEIHKYCTTNNNCTLCFAKQW